MNKKTILRVLCIVLVINIACLVNINRVDISYAEGCSINVTDYFTAEIGKGAPSLYKARLECYIVFEEGKIYLDVYGYYSAELNGKVLTKISNEGTLPRLTYKDRTYFSKKGERTLGDGYVRNRFLIDRIDAGKEIGSPRIIVDLFVVRYDGEPYITEIRHKKSLYIDPKWWINKPVLTLDSKIDNMFLSEEKGYNNICIEGKIKDINIDENILLKYTLTNTNTNTDISDHTNKEILSYTSDGTEKSFNHDITIDSTIPEGNYKLTLCAEDSYGEKVEEVRNFTVDKTSPIISEANLPITESSIEVNCIVSDKYGLASAPYRFTIDKKSTDWVSAPNYIFSDLLPNKEYEIKVEVKDLAGNIAADTEEICTKSSVPSLNILNSTSTTVDLEINDSNVQGTAYQVMNIDNNNYINSSGEETSNPTWFIPDGKVIIVKGLKSYTTYTYKAKARNNEGIETEFSDPASGTTLAPPPAMVPEVTATATSNDITIQWNPVENATAYEVEADGVVTDNSTNEFFTHDELLPNTEHTYRVRAINGEVAGEWSKPITKITLPLASSVPTNLNTFSTEKSITLTWSAVGNATSYDIEVDGEITTNGNSTNYVHTGLLPNTTHSYRVRSVNPAGKSDWSCEVIAKTEIGDLPIPANISADASKNAIEVRWDEIEGMEYQTEADGNIIHCGINPVYIHSNLMPNTEHMYRVRSYKDGSHSDWSSVLAIKTNEAIFKAPTNIKSDATDTSITISWEEVSGADGYDVEVDGVVVDNGLNTYFTHEGLLPNTNHIYRIRARQGDAVSDWSNEVNVVNENTYALSVPENLRSETTETEIVINWDMVEDAVSYDLKIDNQIVKDITDTTYTLSELMPNTQKMITVRAVNEDGTSAFATPIVAITKASSCDIVQSISALTTKSQITLFWEAIQGAVSYAIQADEEVINNVEGNNYTFDGLDPNTNYTYKIKVNREDEVQSDWSKPVIITTMVDVPQAPENLTASSTLNSVRLSWDGAVGAVEYEIETGGQILKAGASNDYLITNLTPNTEYTYKVRAKNAIAIGSWSQPISIKTKSSVQSYGISGNAGEEKNLVINANNIRDFRNYTFTLTYNPEEIEIVDTASQTVRKDLAIGNIVGTDIEVIQNSKGTLQFKKLYAVPKGQSYSGIINVIKIKLKTDNDSSLTYTIQ